MICLLLRPWYVVVFAGHRRLLMGDACVAWVDWVDGGDGACAAGVWVPIAHLGPDGEDED
jgi:hypothetical protein